MEQGPEPVPNGAGASTAGTSRNRLRSLRPPPGCPFARPQPGAPILGARPDAARARPRRQRMACRAGATDSESPMKSGRLLVLLVVVLLVGGFFAFDLDRYLTLAELETRQAHLVEYYRAHPVRTLALYVGLYVALTALSLPVAAVLTLAGGALFGFVVGTVVVSFASALGATAA